MTHMETSVHLITYEESLLMPENKMEEILDGVSRIMPPPTVRHFLLMHGLSKMLTAMLPESEVWPAYFGLGIRRSPFRYRIPDLSVFDAKTLKKAVYGNTDDGYLWIAPFLIAECLSPANRRGNVAELVKDYKSIGVPELWLFRPEQKIFEGYGHSALSTQIDLVELWEAFEGKRRI